MDDEGAIVALSALAQGHRLAVFRLLVKRGPSGLAAGEIGRRVGLSPSSLSFHLAHLERAGLVRSWRVQRNIFYSVEIEGVRRLLAFLTADCCDGRPEICGGLARTDGLFGGDLMTDHKIYNVLFLCTGNSARSILAEAILNREGIGKFKAYSAGSQPKREINPIALDVLRSQNHKVESYRPKDWEEFARPGAPALDFVFTLCDSASAEVCPVWPGQPMTAHWGLPDPAAVEGNQAVRHAAFLDAYRMLTNRISIFVNLPLASLDRLSLKASLDKIGEHLGEPAEQGA